MEEIKLKSEWDKMYDRCAEFQEDCGEIGLGDIADIHEELLEAKIKFIKTRINKLSGYGKGDLVGKGQIMQMLNDLLQGGSAPPHYKIKE